MFDRVHRDLIEDQTISRVAQSLTRAVEELQQHRGVASVQKFDVELPAGEEVSVAHGLGFRAFVQISPVRGASTSGRVEEVLDETRYDHSRVVVLKAEGFGATVLVNVRMS